jgi:signal transduction histidine kinase
LQYVKFDTCNQVLCHVTYIQRYLSRFGSEGFTTRMFHPGTDCHNMGLFIDKEEVRLTTEVSYQRKSIDALLSITNPEADFPSIEKIFQKAIGPIQEITGFETVTARIYDPDRKCFILMAQGGMAPEMVKGLKYVSDDFPIFSEIMKKKAPAVKIPVKLVKDLGYKRTIFVPLVTGDTIVGSIDLPTKTDYIPNDDEFRWLALVGRILGSMIYQAQLMERLQSKAVIQERTRLANELHDDVAQLVRSMRWGLEEARSALENKQLEHAAGILDKLETTVQHTSAYLREEMLSLRERLDSNQGVIPILEGMLLRFERNWGIKTALLTDRNVDTNHSVFLSSHAEIQLIRIVQEALMNVRRHARAHTVTIKVSEDVDSLTFKVIDDGIGFRLEDIPKERLGLRIIRERASSIGAKIQIDSIEGTGTILKIELPGYEGTPL